MHKRDGLLKLQMLDFALEEIAMYLDAYPDSKEALAYRNQLVEMYEHEREEFIEQNGPLSIMDEGNYQKYVNDPWPWEVKR